MEQQRCCEQCGKPLMRVTCGDCDGFGGWWEPAPEPDGWRWHACRMCHDTGQQWKCLDFMTCPGTRWYPLDARCAGIVGIVGMLAAAPSAKGDGNG